MTHATDPVVARAVRTRRPPGWRDVVLAVLVLVIIAMCTVYVLGRQSVDDSTQRNYEQQLIIEKQDALLSQTCLPGQPLAETYHRQPVEVLVPGPDGDPRSVTTFVCVENTDIPPVPAASAPAPGTPNR